MSTNVSLLGNLFKSRLQTTEYRNQLQNTEHRIHEPMNQPWSGFRGSFSSIQFLNIKSPFYFRTTTQYSLVPWAPFAWLCLASTRSRPWADFQKRVIFTSQAGESFEEMVDVAIKACNFVVGWQIVMDWGCHKKSPGSLGSITAKYRGHNPTNYEILIMDYTRKQSVKISHRGDGLSQ